MSNLNPNDIILYLEKNPHSTEAALVSTANDLLTADAGECLDLILLDLSSAPFDTIL